MNSFSESIKITTQLTAVRLHFLLFVVAVVVSIVVVVVVVVVFVVVVGVVVFFSTFVADVEQVFYEWVWIAKHNLHIYL